MVGWGRDKSFLRDKSTSIFNMHFYVLGVDASDSLVDADVSDLNRYKSCFYRVGFQHRK